MIVPMKKIFIIVRASESSSALDRIADMGVLHVNHLTPPQGSNLERLREDIALLDQAIGIIQTEGKNSIQKTFMKIENPLNLAQEVFDLKHQNKMLQEEASRVTGEIIQWSKWGNFIPWDVVHLSQKNLSVRLYQITSKQISQIPREAIVHEIFREGSYVGCAVISKTPLTLPFSDVGLPAMSLEKFNEQLTEVKGKIQQNIAKISEAEAGLGTLHKYRIHLWKELELEETISGMGKYGPLAVFAGFAPADQVETLQKEAMHEHWGLTAVEPDEDEPVPTMLVNNRLVNLMRPLFQFIELVPGYRELDMSPVFFLFFSLFVALLVNDLGYGLVFFGLTAWAHHKWHKKIADHNIFYMFYFLSVVTSIMGILSGTFFGQGWLPSWVHPVIPALRNDTDVQMLCFMIGATHLTIGHIWQMSLKWPALDFLVDLGWISILWCSVLIASTLILGKPLSPIVFYLFGFGTAMILFFTQTKKGFLKNFGEGLGNYVLNLMNNFTDVVSYIRLFAVGLAGVSVAEAFNLMAAGIGFDGVMSALVATFILLFGHTLNIILSPMSILVHGVRLNVLEFSAHVDVKWSGVMYKPLRKGA
jgi:V/A-type H+/Na+-transporting ATPase subunit I